MLVRLVLVLGSLVWFANIFVEAVPVNPCEALKLPLCRVTDTFAKEQGIRQEPRKPVGRRPSLSTDFKFRRPPLPNDRNKDEDNEQKSVKVPFRPTRPAQTDTQDDACKGLIFCKLSKDVPVSQRKTPSSRVTTEAPEIPEADPFEETLISAVLNGHIDTAKELIDNGADVNAADVHGNTVLLIASQNGRTEVIEDLLLKGAEVNHGNNHKNTALHLAAQNGWTEITRKLLKHRQIEVDKKDLHANTALHLAAQNGQIGVAKLLIEAGATINAPNSHKHIPLHLAAQNGHLELSRLLVQNGGDADYPDLIGNTPLHTAVHTTHNEIAQMLVRNGANPKKKNLSGLTPFQLVG